MPYPFLRADERRERTSGPVPGVRLTFAGGVRHFYPGATVELAVALAKAACPPDLYGDPATKIEYGTAQGGVFQAERVIKVPAGEPRADA
jgi:hypothetical protein